MANLSIRKLDDDIVSRLRMHATQHGVSMEEEVRCIITQAVAMPVRLGDMVQDYFGIDSGVDIDLNEKIPHEPINL